MSGGKGSGGGPLYSIHGFLHESWLERGGARSRATVESVRPISDQIFLRAFLMRWHLNTRTLHIKSTSFLRKEYTAVPTPMAPTTAAPSTAAPTTMSPTEVKDACVNLKKRKCRNTCVFSKRQRQCLPKSTGFEHNCAQYEGKTPCLENKVCKFPHGKCVHRCDGKNARRCRKHKFCNLDKVVNPCFGCHLVTACGPRR